MRKQYHFRSSARGLLARGVDRVVALSSGLLRMSVALTAVRELDEPFRFGPGGVSTCRDAAEHARLIAATDLRCPMILSADGLAVNRMQRVYKALLAGLAATGTVRFTHDLVPDYVGANTDELSYDETEIPFIAPLG